MAGAAAAAAGVDRGVTSATLSEARAPADVAIAGDVEATLGVLSNDTDPEVVASLPPMFVRSHRAAAAAAAAGGAGAAAGGAGRVGAGATAAGPAAADADAVVLTLGGDEPMEGAAADHPDTHALPALAAAAAELPAPVAVSAAPLYPRRPSDGILDGEVGIAEDLEVRLSVSDTSPAAAAAAAIDAAAIDAVADAVDGLEVEDAAAAPPSDGGDDDDAMSGGAAAADMHLDGDAAALEVEDAAPAAGELDGDAVGGGGEGMEGGGGGGDDDDDTAMAS